jgi:DNA replication and repair protein RecF
MKNLPLKKFASQGQLKSFVLSMKLAQYEILKKILNISPILLLDDIFDKLDANRVKQLLEILLNKDFGQIFLTDTHVDRISAILDHLDIVPFYKKIVIEER